ncbi:hypothetical protein [Alicyclobacillus acidiphilus]|uniref:hypothetical protein n=1 Tax=Alicyclobacillus acidiphilus TaxID=182455 RepID=UPI0008314470|nr:hypothetical protein [Alicyclobacillus acidiphilus]
MAFDEDYKEFLEWHRNRRSGERRRRLIAGMGHAEELFLRAVWWRTFRHFSNLHPQYEILDYREGYRYLDFAYIQPHFHVAIEIDGFGPHWRNISSWQFDDHCQRQNHLVIDGWYVIRFTYNQIREQPRLCQQTLQQLFGRWLANGSSSEELTVLERETVRMAARSVRPITPKELCRHLDIGPDYAQHLLRGLVEKQWLQPASGNVRIRSYDLHASRNDIRL